MPRTTGQSRYWTWFPRWWNAACSIQSNTTRTVWSIAHNTIVCDAVVRGTRLYRPLTRRRGPGWYYLHWYVEGFWQSGSSQTIQEAAWLRFQRKASRLAGVLPPRSDAEGNGTRGELAGSSSEIRSPSRSIYYSNLIDQCACDSRKLFRVVNSLSREPLETALPEHDDPTELANKFGTSLVKKNWNHKGKSW